MKKVFDMLQSLYLELKQEAQDAEDASNNVTEASLVDYHEGRSEALEVAANKLKQKCNEVGIMIGDDPDA